MDYRCQDYHQPMIILVILLLLVTVSGCGGAATEPAKNLHRNPQQTAAPGGPSDPTNTPTPSPQPSPTPNPVATPPVGTQSPPAPTLPPTGAPFPTPEPTDTPDTPATVVPETLEPIAGLVVTVGEATFSVELAATSEEQVQGLSDRSSLAPGGGMLFVYERQRKLNFWMKNMHFSLDIVWIGTDCTVVDITRNAPPPAPDQSTAQLPIYSPEVPAQYVLEINSGEADSQSIVLGDRVEFTGDLFGRFGC